MTVQELIEHLQQFDPELPVITEQCDGSVFYGAATHAEETEWIDPDSHGERTTLAVFVGS